MISIRNVAVGISGGVDSSVAALLLKKRGFNIIGVFMKNWDLTDEYGICSVSQDFEDAKYACSILKIPFYEVNFVKEYWNEVFLNFTSEYENGLTPNPDIMCNKHIKFNKFYKHAIYNLKVDAIATGHYAKTSFGDFLENYDPKINVKLLKPKDLIKDQTFFLSQVSQEALKKTMFPLSSFVKEAVKKIAVENGLTKIAHKPESMGICFIGSRKYQEFMSNYVAPKPGNFIDITTGKIEGTHDGFHLWTLGQRCRIGGKNRPFYVVQKILKTSDILVAPANNHSTLYSSYVITEKPHWIADTPELDYIQELDFRFQHTKKLIKCVVYSLKSGSLFLVLKKPLRALTPGQYAVFYKNEECLGGAKILNIGPSEFSLGNKIPDNYEEYS